MKETDSQSAEKIEHSEPIKSEIMELTRLTDGCNKMILEFENETNMKSFAVNKKFEFNGIEYTVTELSHERMKAVSADGEKFDRIWDNVIKLFEKGLLSFDGYTVQKDEFLFRAMILNLRNCIEKDYAYNQALTIQKSAIEKEESELLKHKSELEIKKAEIDKIVIEKSALESQKSELENELKAKNTILEAENITKQDYIDIIDGYLIMLNDIESQDERNELIDLIEGIKIIGDVEVETPKMADGGKVHEEPVKEEPVHLTQVEEYKGYTIYNHSNPGKFAVTNPNGKLWTSKTGKTIGYSSVESAKKLIDNRLAYASKRENK